MKLEASGLMFAAIGWMGVVAHSAAAADPIGSAAVVEAYTLAYVSAEDGVRKVREVFAGSGYSSADMDVVPDMRSNSLIVAGPPYTQQLVAQLLREIDVASVAQEAVRDEAAILEELEPLAADTQLYAKVVKLENANCEEVARQVAALFETGETPHKVRWFAPANAVLMRSTAAEVYQMEGIISALDVPAARPQPGEADRPETDIIYLEHADARELADVVRAHASPPEGGRRRRVVPLQVLVADRLNSLILKGPKSVIGEAKALVAKLDIPISSKRPLAGQAVGAPPKPSRAGQTSKRAKRG